MQLISKYNKRIRFLSWVTDIFSKDASLGPIKDKKRVDTVNEFQSILDNQKENQTNMGRSG